MVNVKELRAYLVEFIGTFIIVIVTCWSLQALKMNKITVKSVALANGLVVAVCIWAGITKSGSHFNPVITIVKLMLRKLTLTNAVGYIIVQLVSSIFAGLILILLVPFNNPLQKLIIYPEIPQNTNHSQVFIFEFIFSCLYVLLYQATIIDKNAPSNIFGFAIGGVMALAYMTILPFSGACVNPVRNFGPALLSGDILNSGTYWIATITGGILGGFYYDFFLTKPLKEKNT